MEKQPKSAQKSRHKVKNAGDRSRMLKMSKSSSKASPSKSLPQQIEIKPKDFICPSEAKQSLTEAFEEIKYQCATFKPGERSQFAAEDDVNPVDSDQYFSLAGTDAENSFEEEEEEVCDSMEVADTTGDTEEVVQLDKAELERKEFCSGDCVDQQPVSSEECFEEHQCVNKTEDTDTLEAAPNKLESSGETADMDMSDSAVTGRIEVCSGSDRMDQSSFLAEGDSTDSSWLINEPMPLWPDVSSSDYTYDSPTMHILATLKVPVLLLETEDEDSFNAQPDLENQKEEDDSKELSWQENEIEDSVNQSQPENIESCKENPVSQPDLKDLETEAKVESSLQINQEIPEKEESCNEISDAQPDQKNCENVVGDEESCQATLKIEEKESTGEEQPKTGPILINPESETSLKGTPLIDMDLSKSCSVCEPAMTVSSLKRSLTTPSPRSVIAKTVTSTPEPQRGKIPEVISRYSTPKTRSHRDTPQPKSKLPRLTAKNKYNNVKAKVDSNLMSGKKSSILKKQAVQEQPKELAVSWGKPIEQLIQQDSGEPELSLEMETLKEPEIEKLEEKQEEKVKEQDYKPEEQQAKEEKTAKMVMEVEKDPKALEDDWQWEVSPAELQAAPWPEEPLEQRLRHDTPDEKNNGKVLLGVAAIAVAGYAAYSNWDTIVKKSAALLEYLAPRHRRPRLRQQTMPALKLFGRRWLLGSDDFVLPGALELALKLPWLGLILVVVVREWILSDDGCPNLPPLDPVLAAIRTRLVERLRVYVLVSALLLLTSTITVAVLIVHSARGSPIEEDARKNVPYILKFKFSLMFPELIWNIFGSLWVYELGEVMPRCPGEAFASTVIKGVLIFNWVSLTATLFGLALLFDPMGSSRFYAPCDGGTTCEDHQHERYAERSRDIWLRRFSWLFCWMQPDEHSRTAFNDVAGLFSALFRSTNLVPSDVAAAFVLLRVRQKQEVRLQREKLAESRGDQEWTQHFPTHAQGISAPLNLDEETRIIGAPDWMKLSTAKHYLKFSMAAYGWPLVMYLHCFTGLFRLLPYMSCCGCIRSKTPRVVEDNCCLCNVAGMRTLSGVPSHDILYASFRNRLFEVPFLVVADHSTKSIVVVMRGSISVRDIFTDFTAASYELEAPELPPNCKGHKGMIHVAQYVLKTLEQEHVLTEAFDSYPDYELVLTGHSLGAGVAVMLGLMLKPTYPKLRCFAFAAPGGLLCPEAAVASESFTLTVGLGDDLVMRLGVDSIENLRTDLLTAIHRCVEPKYRMLVDGFMYVLFGVPDRVLERTWENANADEKRKRRSTSQYRTIKKLVIGPAHSIEASRLACNVASRRFSEQRLYSPGKILHITRCKSAGPNGTDRRRHHELRWASKEHFTQLRVMPRMILDHLPENILAALDDLLDEHEQRVSSGLESVEVSSS